MEVKINREIEPKRKVVAFIKISGGVVFRNRDDNYSTVVTNNAECYQGGLSFDQNVKAVEEANRIYEGDSITITF